LADFFILSYSATCAVFALLLAVQEIGDVNRTRADADQIPYRPLSPAIMRTVRAEYAAHYPKGRIETWRTVCKCGVLGFLGAFAARAAIKLLWGL